MVAACRRTVTVLCLLVCLCFAPTAQAAPGVGTFSNPSVAPTSFGECGAPLIISRQVARCLYVFTTVVHSELFEVAPPGAKVCTTGSGTVAVRQVIASAVDGQSPRLDDLVLNGVPPTRCIYNVPPGVYWIEVVTASGTTRVAVDAL